MQRTTIPLYSRSQLKICVVWLASVCLNEANVSMIFRVFGYFVLFLLCLVFFFTRNIFFFSFSISFFAIVCFGFFWSVFLFPLHPPNTRSQCGGGSGGGDGDGVYVMYTIRFISFRSIRNVHIPWPLVNGFYALLLLYIPATALFASLGISRTHL